MTASPASSARRLGGSANDALSRAAQASCSARAAIASAVPRARTIGRDSSATLAEPPPFSRASTAARPYSASASMNDAFAATGSAAVSPRTNRAAALAPSSGSARSPGASAVSPAASRWKKRTRPPLSAASNANAVISGASASRTLIVRSSA